MGSQGERHSRESENLGGITRGNCIVFLDASLRWHDGNSILRDSGLYRPREGIVVLETGRLSSGKGWA
jgi:hypothetical protein